jgi:hypothetical protein
MLHSVAALILTVASTAWSASAPLKINFQGKLLDPATNTPRNGNIGMEFRIIDSPTIGSGNVIWGPESQTVAVNNGVFAVQLGAVTALNPDMLAASPVYLSVTVSPDVFASNQELNPRQQLVASPFAYTATQLAQAGNVRINAGVSYSTFTSGGNLLVSAGVVAGTGTFTGGLTASSGTFTATGATQFSLKTSSGISMTGGTLLVDAGSKGINAQGTGIIASTGTFTATGNTQYSVITSSGINIQAGELRVSGHAALGLTYRNYVGNNVTLRCACTAAGTKALSGGCSSGTRVAQQIYPSTESTDSTGTAGTAVADGATQAFSYTCVFSGAAATNACYVVCARVSN